MRYLSFLALSIALVLPATAAPEPAPGFLDPQDGETVVFLGDSITHQALYTQYVETFFYTRYPDRKIRFHNAGVSGDKAADALARFDEDVAALAPDFVTVLLGMNDGQYEPFSSETFATYRQGVEELLSRIEAIGAKPIVLSPTMFDHHQLAVRMEDETFRFRDRSFDPGYNALLAYYGAWLRERCGGGKATFVDLWSPLNDYTFEQRRREPNFSLIEDAIHPGAAGQFVMAFELLYDSRQERSVVSNLTVQRRGEKWIAAKNETIAELAPDEKGDGVTFVHQARSLPWVVPETTSEYELKWGPSAPPSLGADLTRAGHRIGREQLRVAGLAPGNYELSIDGVVIGQFTQLHLGSKIELQQSADSPQSRQAHEVAKLNRERNDEAVRPMRDLWAKVKGLRRSGDSERFEREYPELLDQIGKLRDKAAEYEERIYGAAQPTPRRYLIRRID